MEIFVIFGCPRGARRAPFWEKKASFLRSEILMIFGQITLGGRRHRGGQWGRGILNKEEISEDSEGMMTEDLDF